jgi:UDP-2,4-diacetamido-2,4,6-trideoxy-beta-L-altropyranose hydrolase
VDRDQSKGGSKDTGMNEMMMLVRADAGPQIGIGHVMRCLALAQAWLRMGGKATFIFASDNPALEARLIEEGMDVAHIAAQPGSDEDMQQTVGLARQKGAAWVVVDGYHFPAAYQHALKANALRVFWIDDYGHAEYYAADWVLNQNIYAGESLYRHRESYTRLLLGPRYALLRQEFLNWRSWRRSIPEVARKVLVTMGGGDPANTTLRVICALDKVAVEGMEIIVVVGSTNPHVEMLKATVHESTLVIRVKQTISEMPELMAWADLAVSGAGSTCWELAFMGVPSLLLVLAENPRAIAEGLEQAGVAINLGWSHQVSNSEVAKTLQGLCQAGEQRSHMSWLGRQLVDGIGTSRVIQSLGVVHGRENCDADSVVRQ